MLFDRWCQSTNVHNFEDLTHLILLEEFKNCLPDRICSYINKQKVKTVADAAILAEEYVLTHRDNDRGAQQVKPFVSLPKPQFMGEDKTKDVANSAWSWV